jgi:rhodanese-related sulfurtransferase
MEIEPAEVARRMKENANALRLLDVRTAGEYQIAHVDGGVLVDQALVDEIVTTWPKDTEIVTMCHHGIRSLDAAAFLRAHGFPNVWSMRGGIDLWSAVVDPKVPQY